MARILYLTPGYTVHDYRFLSKLSESGHQVWYQPCTSSSITESRPLPNGVQGREPLSKQTFGWRSVPAMLKALKQTIREIEPDLIHAGSVPTGGFLTALAGFHPSLVMSWGSDVLVQANKNFMQRLVAKYTLGKADMALGDCEAVSQSIQTLSRLKQADIVSLPWGIRLADFEDVQPHPVREQLGWQGRTVLIATRGFEPIHCPMLILQGFAANVKQYPGIRLLMLGKGRLEDQARRFISYQRLDRHVHLASQVSNNELPAYFKTSDLYVSGTLSDGTSISLLEAMASGLPVIVTDAYGNKEWVAPGENGWRYTPGDVPDFTRTLAEALRLSDRYAAIGRQNRQTAHIRADWDKNFTRVLDAYSQLIGGRKS